MPAPCSPLKQSFVISIPNATFLAGNSIQANLSSDVPIPLLQGVQLKFALVAPNATNGTGTVQGPMSLLAPVPTGVADVNGTLTWGFTLPGTLLQKVGFLD